WNETSFTLPPRLAGSCWKMSLAATENPRSFNWNVHVRRSPTVANTVPQTLIWARPAPSVGVAGSPTAVAVPLVTRSAKAMLLMASSAKDVATVNNERVRLNPILHLLVLLAERSEAITCSAHAVASPLPMSETPCFHSSRFGFLRYHLLSHQMSFRK